MTEKTPMQIAVVCRNASGCADMPVFTVSVTEEEYDLGVHYDKAEEMADEAGYEGPFVCFDRVEQPRLLEAVYELNIAPQVVVIDMTGGSVNSVRSNTGLIDVICYDEDETEEYSEAVGDHPVGENGQVVRCWFHRQTAEPDPGLGQLLT